MAIQAPCTRARWKSWRRGRSHAFARQSVATVGTIRPLFSAGSPDHCFLTSSLCTSGCFCNVYDELDLALRCHSSRLPRCRGWHWQAAGTDPLIRERLLAASQCCGGGRRHPDPFGNGRSSRGLTGWTTWWSSSNRRPVSSSCQCHPVAWRILQLTRKIAKLADRPRGSIEPSNE